MYVEGKVWGSFVTATNLAYLYSFERDTDTKKVMTEMERNGQRLCPTFAEAYGGSRDC